MEPFSLGIEVRTETGKGAARKMRAKGLVPGVFYGRDAKTLGVAIAPKALTQALSTPQRRNVLLKLDAHGETHLAMVKELQLHPVSRAVLHVDLYKVSLEQRVLASVPLLTEGRAKGVIEGGEITVVYRDVPLRCTPDKIPAEIKVDVTNMALGDSLRAKDIALPEGVEIMFDPERSLVTCAEPRKLPPEEEATPGAVVPGAAPAAGETPAAATPAAKPAAKPAAQKP